MKFLSFLKTLFTKQTHTMKKTYTPEQLKAILADHKLWLESYGDKGTRAILDGASLDGASLFLARVNYTAGPLLVIGRQGEYSRDAILNTELKTVQIGCFCGSFDAAREAIREKYGDKADAVTGGYGLTLLAMDAIEQEGEKRKESESAE